MAHTRKPQIAVLEFCGLCLLGGGGGRGGGGNWLFVNVEYCCLIGRDFFILGWEASTTLDVSNFNTSRLFKYVLSKEAFKFNYI